MIKSIHTVIALMFALMLSSQVLAETQPLKQTLVPYSMSSGEQDNLAEASSTVFEEVVTADNTPWLRLTLNGTQLSPGSSLRITSLEDGHSQSMDANALEQWGYTSAYFNGSAVRVELIAGPGTRANRVEVTGIIVGEWQVGTESQCGPTDDRVASNEPQRGRLLNIGCSASIAATNSCMITAGHCLSLSSFVNVVEFNVPPSMTNGTIVHPAPEDQYSVTEDRDFTDGGVGNDWGVFTVFANTETGLMPFEAQGSNLTVTTTTPAVDSLIDIVGYGVDTGVDNQTQQISIGPVTANGGTTLSYQSDTEGGNSGSAVTAAGTTNVVAIHTHGGCSPSGAGSNSGTQAGHPDFQAAVNLFCATTPPTGVTCGDIQVFRSACRAGGNLIAGARLTDVSHSGETITISVDGVDNVVTINNSRALLRQLATPGIHTVELVQPAGCADPIVVRCR